MRTAFHSAFNPPATRRRAHPQQTAAYVGIIALAVLSGIFIGSQNWIYVLVLGLAVILLQAPVLVAFAGFVLLIPFEPILAINNVGRKVSIDSLVGLIASIVFLVIGSATGRLKRPTGSALLWSCFALWAITTSLWAVNTQVAVQQLPGIIAAILFYLAAVSLQFTARELRWVFKISIIAGALAAVVAVHQFYNGRLFGNDLVGYGRGSLIVGSQEVNPNLFAFTLLLPFAAAVAWFFEEEKWLTKLLILGMLAPISLAVFLSMSRSASLSLLIIVVVFLYRRGLSWRVFVPVSLISLLVVILPQLFFSRLEEAAKTGGSGRLDIWHAGLMALKSYGLWGAGPNNFGVVYTQFSGYAPHFMGYIRDSHNTYLQVGVDFGVLGLVLFFAAVISQFRELSLFRKTHTQVSTWLIACEGTCYALLFTQLFSNDLWRKHFWLPWILLAAVMRMRQESKRTVRGAANRNGSDNGNAFAYLDPQVQTTAEIQ